MTIHADPTPAPAPTIQITQHEQAQAGARAFTAAGTPQVTLVVWDRDSDLHSSGEVWGLYVDGRPPRHVDGLEERVEAVISAAQAHFGDRLHVQEGQRGLSEVEEQVMAAAGLVAA